MTKLKNIIKKFSICATVAAGLMAGTSAQAKEYWSDNSITILYGTTFKLPFGNTTTDEKRYVFTLEHMSDNSWGDTFGFMDTERSFQGHRTQLYGEFLPRLSLFRISSYEAPKDNFLQDILLAYNAEAGVDVSGFNQYNNLVGIGTTLNVPLFQYLKLNFFHRINQRTSNNWQFTPVFGIPFTIGKADFKIDGWADFVSATAGVNSNVHTQIQAKWDIGKALMNKPQTFYVGTEFKYWKNKFGVQGVTETVWQLLAQAHF
jgi:nucleoside-specific outer membrane channel protein Tsx